MLQGRNNFDDLEKEREVWLELRLCVGEGGGKQSMEATGPWGT